MELDLTNSHLPSLDEIDIPTTLTSLDLTANRLKEVDARILALEGLQTLNFRQNLLPDITSWNDCHCKDNLRELEFRDNQIKQIPVLTGFTSLRRLDLSYNELRTMEPLEHLKGSPLEELYLQNNKITAIRCLEPFPRLKVLELGSNRIRVIEHLGHLTNLEELWLGRNRMTEVTGLESLKQLRRISLQSNRLVAMRGLEACTSLEELYLSHNGIGKLEGLDTLTNLKILDVSNNALSRLEDLGALSQLEDLWLNDNQISSLDGIEQQLAAFTDTLTTIYLENNPAADDPMYRDRLLALFPHLCQLDANVLQPLK